MFSRDNRGTPSFRPCRDPYDLWASKVGVAVRRRYYSCGLLGKVSAVGLGVLDWLLPEFGRRVIGAKSVYYPIVVAHEVLQHHIDPSLETHYSKDALYLLQSIAGKRTDEFQWAWGLRFPWMSKNGLYGPEISFVTHTPYVMEALLALAENPRLNDEAMNMFHGTLPFLESLRVMHKCESLLALSYAPVVESRIVVNANAYAAHAYAMHSAYGRVDMREEVILKAEKLARWVVSQQQPDGSWWYYADSEQGNFIDCFHSCFVIKNLLKVKALLPEATAFIDPSVDKGWAFIRKELFDTKAGMCRRFTVQSHRDPFRWDLYDQAEYLGLLVDFGALEDAFEFSERVERRFKKGEHWFCRIDIFGRRWGKGFKRWGIVPFQFQKLRMERASSER